VDAAESPSVRVNVTPGLRLALLLRDIEDAAGEYVTALAAGRPGLSIDGCRLLVRREVEQLADVEAAAGYLERMHDAIEENRDRPNQVPLPG
jgi:hypothetical protein